MEDNVDAAAADEEKEGAQDEREGAEDGTEGAEETGSDWSAEGEPVGRSEAKRGAGLSCANRRRAAATWAGTLEAAERSACGSEPLPEA